MITHAIASRRARRGFTLIEALAAIAILVIVIPVLLGGFNIAGNIAEMTRQTANATSLAQSKMEELIATQTYTGNGQEQVGVDAFSWQATLESWENESNVQQLTMEVSWMHRGAPCTIHLATIIYQPGSTIQTTATPLSGRTQ